MKIFSKSTRILVCASVVMLAWALLPPTLLGQMQVGSGGQALDANLQMGSGGYNSRRGVQSTTWSRPAYTPGSSKPLYTVSSSGGMQYSDHNAFNPRSTYTSTGYTDDYTTTASLRRVRY